jgi:large subunit ribosomal protein L4
MATAIKVDLTGKSLGEAKLSDTTFAAPVHSAVMHQALLRELANGRQGTSATKTRGEVRGGGRKPYAQKGTGRARQGSIRAPHYRGGGVIFGPHPRKYTMDLPRKERRGALLGALSAQAEAGNVVVLDGFEMDQPQTKTVASLIAGIRASTKKDFGKLLFVLDAHNERFELSSRNLREARVVLVENLSIHDLLTADGVVFTAESLTKINRIHEHE